MTSKPSHPLKAILHPYIFVLKEGRKIKKDFLDYSLMMLFVNSTETLSSPIDEDLLNIPIEREEDTYPTKVEKKKRIKKEKFTPSLI